MDYHSIVFREFTPESLHRIERYRQEEAERIASERLQRQTIREDDGDQLYSGRKSSKYEPIGPKRKPNKELAVGQTLPRVLQSKFPAELIGKPIEEIDWYHRTEYVRILPNTSRLIPKVTLGIRGDQPKQNHLSVQFLAGLLCLLSIQLLSTCSDTHPHTLAV